MLAVEIEYLSGVSYSARPHSESRPEWPPHPDRLFMALVSAWGDERGEAGAEALRWLERQPPPDISAPAARERDAPAVFVPVSGGRAAAGTFGPGTELGLVQGVRRKGRYFPAAALPDGQRSVWMVWRGPGPPPGAREALSGLASRVPYVGHSASLVRVEVAPPGAAPPPATHVPDRYGDELLRCPEAGRLDDLAGRFERARVGPGGGTWRPPVATARRYGAPSDDAPAGEMAGGDEWIVLSCAGGRVPSLEAFPVAAKRMRDALMSHAEGPVCPEISGHGAGGGPLRGPHLAVLPMANVGWDRSDGGLMGIALVMPRGSGYYSPECAQLRGAVDGFLGGGGAGELRVGRSAALRLADGGGAASLRPGRYAGRGRLWASATPVVLDRHPKRSKPAEDVIAGMCERRGLPRPASVQVSRYPFVRGSPPAHAAGRARGGWIPPRPGVLDGRYLCHAAVDFGRDVRGPVILGAGRHYGLGLFMRTGGKHGA